MNRPGAYFKNRLSAFPRAFARVGGLALLALLFFNSGAAVGARQAQTSAPPPAAEDESESVPFGAPVRPRVTDPGAIIRAARTVFIRSKTVFVKDSEVENALLKRAEFQAWGLRVTRDEAEADLIIEIERKVFTKRFVFTVVDPRSMTVVASGKARSIIFGDTIAHKVAEKFVNRVKPVRAFAPPKAP